jgi:hypothetical protein
MVGNNRQLVLVNNSLVRRNSETVHCHDEKASPIDATMPKRRVKSSHIFMQQPQNITVALSIDCLACQDEFSVNIPLDVIEKEEQALDFALHLSHQCPSR